MTETFRTGANINPQTWYSGTVNGAASVAEHIPVVGGAVGGTLRAVAGTEIDSGFTTGTDALYREGKHAKNALGFGHPPTYSGVRDPLGKGPDGGGSLTDATNKSVERTGADGDAKTTIEAEYGKDATTGWENMAPAQREDLIRQAAISRAGRLGARFTALLAAINDMLMAIIRNIRVG